MIIGFDASRAFNIYRTGTENYSYQLLKSLAKIDRHNQYLVYLRPGTQSLAFQGWPKNFSFKTINWVKLWTQGGLAAQTFLDPLDVLFIPAHALPIIHKPGLKTVVTVHDLGSEYLPQAHQLKQRLYLSFMQSVQLQGATRIIAVSQATKDDLISKVGMELKRIKVVYEGVDKEFFKQVKDDALISTLKRYDIEKEKYFLFVGTVQPRKNLERIIIAFSRQLSVIRQKNKKSGDRRLKTDDYLVIVGQKGWLSGEIYELPKKLGIEDKVKFLGYVPTSDMPALYSGAKALLFPSLFEGFGLPILEAQACGCPVLASNTSSIPEVAGKGAILVDPYSIDDIVKGMLKIQNSEFRIKLIKAGRKNTNRFSWEKCARETLGVLEGI